MHFYDFIREIIFLYIIVNDLLLKKYIILP